ncbi:MAG: hypothetical protein IIX77_05145 [Oscillospiraceae bacterium]|nr:hypothetical protein [Oscillospiraceae bacterium]
MFTLPTYTAPDFSALGNCPDCTFVPAPADGVAPAGYHSTSMFPEYFKVKGSWLLIENSRMDCTAVLRDGAVYATEFRNLKAGDLVAIGRVDDGSLGIYLHDRGFDMKKGGQADTFAFRLSRSRETGYSSEYATLTELLRHEKEHGKIVWVMGPACSFDAGARECFAALVRGGYVHGVMAGNALATHDMEGSFLGTALGVNIKTQTPVPMGHYHHLDVINAVRAAGGIKNFVDQGNVTDGIVYECVKKDVPLVLVGSVRDDGPLPEVYGNVYQGQDAMRSLISDATTVICMATTLHTIATGNMTPSYRVVNGKVRPLYFYTIDTSEFSVGKLADRGSLSAKSIVTNVQDFLFKLGTNLEVL